MPTPLVLGCFCEECQTQRNLDSLYRNAEHEYHLYGVIMHLGATMASGHYVAYVKARDSSGDYESCTRERRKTASLSAGMTNSAVSTSTSSSNNSDKSTLKKKWFFRGPKNGSLTESRGPYFKSTCRGADCCGVRLRTEETTDPIWLECDDETVRVITKKQLEEILAQKQPKNSALTPYLLFYARQ